jgi:O-antigen/teichoic acid export membrane protein
MATSILERIKQFLFHNTTTSQTIAKNSFWLSVSNIGGRLIRAAIIIYSARILGAAEWGVFSYAVTLVAFFTIFVDLGINPIITREASKTEAASEQAKLISTAFIARLVLLLFGILLIGVIAPRFVTLEGARALLPITSLILVFDVLRETGFALNRALERMEREAGLYLLTNLSIVVFGFIFLKFHPSAKSFTYAYALGTGIGMISTFYVLRENFRKIFSNFTPSLVKKIISSGWPFAISGLLGSLMINTDILIIGWVRSAEEVGFYSAAQRIVQLIYIFPAILAISVMPSLARLANKDNSKLRLILEKIISFSFLLAIPIAIGGFIMGRQIIGFVFGGGYLLATLSFQILILTIIIDFPATILSNAIFAYDRQKNLIIYSAIGGILNIILDFALIPSFGITGCAFATLIAQFISNIYLRKTMKGINYFQVLPHIKRVILASVLMGAVALTLTYSPLNVFISIAITGLTYFAILYALKEPLIRDIKSILQPSASDEPMTSESISV